MARRESQGLQIALISFVILTIVLLLTTYYFFSRSQTLAQEADDAKQKSTSDATALSGATDENIKLRKFLGYGDRSPEIGTIESNHASEMASYAQGAEDSIKNYRDLPDYMQKIIASKNDSLAQAQQQINQLNAEINAVRNAEQKRTDEFKTTAEQTTEKLADARNQSNKDVQGATATVAELRKKIGDMQSEYQTTLAQKDKEIADATDQIKNLLLAKERLEREKYELTTESFDRPDGTVISATPGSNRVLINLGSADGLRPQVRFTVVKADSNNLATAKKKGVIEVTDIKGRNLAYAKIIPEESDVRNPIIEGDLLFSPLWDRGGKLRFALVGAMDVNGDGMDDRDEIRDLIRLSGGIVDAEDTDGGVTGRISTDTRYLVKGSRPGDSANAANDRNAYTKLIDDAVRMGVEQISVRKLANYVGFRGRRRAIPMGSGARGEDFRPEPINRSNYTRY